MVDATTEALLADDELQAIFTHISSIPSLRDLAPVLDLHVLTFVPTGADQPGIVATVTAAFSDRGISIRQTVSEDPEFTDDPRLYVITDEPIPGDLIEELQALPFTRKIELE